MFLLEDFETDIDGRVLLRGKEYYEQGAVHHIAKSGEGAYRAVVMGSEQYTVSVRLSEDGGEIIDFSCDCPYDAGPMCKHTVAVLYALRDNLQPVSTIREAEIISPAKQDETLAHRLNQCPKEELVELLMQEQRDNSQFRRRIGLSYGTEEDFENTRFVMKIIREVLDDAKDGYGFIGYAESLDAVQGALEVLDFAEQFLAHRPRATLRICESVIDVLAPVLNRCDDSNGDISGALMQATEVLRTLAGMPLDDALHKEFFSYLLVEHTKKVHQGYDVPWELLNIAATLATAAETTKLFSAIDAYVDHGLERRKAEGRSCGSDGFFDRFDMERAAEIQLVVVQKYHGDDAVRKFLMEHLALPSLREKAVDYFLLHKDTETAKRLAYEGIEQAKKDSHMGTAFSFRKRLLAAAELERDVEEIARQAKILFLENHQHESIYYEMLKKHTEPSAWPDVWKEIEGALISGDAHTLAELYKREKEGDSLMKLMEQQPYLMPTYDSSLAGTYPKRVGVVYRELVNEHMNYPAGRGAYQEKCRLLTRMQRLDNDLVADIVREWRKKYEKRRALMEELRKAGF